MDSCRTGYETSTTQYQRDERSLLLPQRWHPLLRRVLQATQQHARVFTGNPKFDNGVAPRLNWYSLLL